MTTCTSPSDASTRVIGFLLQRRRRRACAAQAGEPVMRRSFRPTSSGRSSPRAPATATRPRLRVNADVAMLVEARAAFAAQSATLRLATPPPTPPCAPLAADYNSGGTRRGRRRRIAPMMTVANGTTCRAAAWPAATLRAGCDLAGGPDRNGRVCCAACNSRTHGSLDPRCEGYRRIIPIRRPANFKNEARSAGIANGLGRKPCSSRRRAPLGALRQGDQPRRLVVT